MDATHTDVGSDVIVVGAGLAGLAAGVAAARAGARVVVVDGHPAGGRARTDSRRGFRFNQGAHALYLGGHATRVLEELGAGVPAGGAPSNDQWGIAGDLISPLPFSPGKALRSKLVDTVGKAQLARLIGKLRSMDPASVADRSASAWIDGLGMRPGAAAVLRTLSHVATYADDLDAMSADTVVSQLKAVLKGGVRYLDGGWQTMVDALVAALTAAGGSLQIGSAAIAVEPASGRGGLAAVGSRPANGTDRLAVVGSRPSGGAGSDGDLGGGGLTVRLVDGTVLQAGAVVVASGGPASVASLLPEPPHWGLIGPPALAACLDLGLRRPPTRPILFGVGEPLYLSTHSGPAAGLAPEGQYVVHVMRYGARDAATDKAELWALARAAGIGEDDVIEQRFLAHMVVTQAVPVPGSGLAGRPSVESAGVEGVYVAGDWVGPDGLLGDAALASGQRAGVAAAKRSTRVPA